MTDSPDTEYARLPAELLDKILRQAPEVVTQVEQLLAPALEQQDALRAAAIDHDLIVATTRGAPMTLAAVDGGFAVERTIAVDIVLAVAVGVEGFSPTGLTRAWAQNQYEAFHEVMLHTLDNERLARAATIVHELTILADAPHGVRVYDGSHLTPIIQYNSGLSSKVDSVNTRTVEHGLAHGIVEAFTAFAANPAIIAMPKYDSSHEVAKSLGTWIGQDIPGDDRYVTSLVLEAGEYTTPRPVPAGPWAQLHFTAAAGTFAEHSGIAHALEVAIAPLQAKKMYYTYWKPLPASPAYRIEIKPELATDVGTLNRVFASLADQMAAPYVREPYPQYLADVMAKSVSLGLEALQSAAHLRLAKARPALASQLVHSYRTEGK